MIAFLASDDASFMKANVAVDGGVSASTDSRHKVVAVDRLRELPVLRGSVVAVETPERLTCGRSTSCRANCSMQVRNSGFDVSPGDLGENITTAALDLETLPFNTEIRIGPSANIRLTGLRTPCILIDRFNSGLRGRLLDATPNPPFRAGIMAVVSEGGEISPGDAIRAILPERPHLPLPPL